MFFKKLFKRKQIIIWCATCYKKPFKKKQMIRNFLHEIFSANIFSQNYFPQNFFRKIYFSRNFFSQNFFSQNFFSQNFFSQNFFSQNLFYRLNTLKKGNFAVRNFHGFMVCCQIHKSLFIKIFKMTIDIGRWINQYRQSLIYT